MIKDIAVWKRIVHKGWWKNRTEARHEYHAQVSWLFRTVTHLLFGDTWTKV